MWDQIKGLPPWVSLLALLGAGGGGGIGTAAFNYVTSKFDSLQTVQDDLVRKIDGLEWRYAGAENRLDANRVRGAERDVAIRKLERLTDRLETLRNLPPAQLNGRGPADSPGLGEPIP